MLLQALYGLQKSPRLWLQDLTSTLSKLRLQQTDEEYYLFADNGLLIFFYVNNIMVLYKKEHQKTFKYFIKKLIEYYDLRDMDELS